MYDINDDDGRFDNRSIEDVKLSVEIIKDTDKKLYIDDEDEYEDNKANPLLVKIAEQHYNYNKTTKIKKKSRNPNSGIYSKFTISLNITQVQELRNYSKNNNIKTSELIRNLLCDNKIISNLDDIKIQSSNTLQRQQEKDSVINKYFKKHF